MIGLINKLLIFCIFFLFQVCILQQSLLHWFLLIYRSNEGVWFIWDILIFFITCRYTQKRLLNVSIKLYVQYNISLINCTKSYLHFENFTWYFYYHKLITKYTTNHTVSHTLILKEYINLKYSFFSGGKTFNLNIISYAFVILRT